MTFNVAQLKESLNAMSPEERKVAQDKLLADYARHAAFGRPLGPAGISRLFVVARGMEEDSLAEDKDMVSIRSLEELKLAIETRKQPLLLIRSIANIPDNQIISLLEKCADEKTVFIAR